MVKSAKRKPEPLLPLVSATLFVQQHHESTDYQAFTRYAALLKNAEAVFTEPLLYLGHPHAVFAKQCERMLISPKQSNTRKFHSGLRLVGSIANAIAVYVGDYKRNYKDPNERGLTLIAVLIPASQARPSCLLLFVTPRNYFKKRPNTNTVYAQQFYKKLVRPYLSGWLQALPTEEELALNGSCV